MLDRNAWVGLVGPRVATAEVEVQIPLQASQNGESGTFLASDQNGDRWWVKPVNNLQAPLVTVAEFLVGRVGSIIGAPVCDVEIVEIPPDLAGYEFRPGSSLEPGLACGSKDVPGTHEMRALAHRDKDDNRRRHAGIYAIYDWCWGLDDQWLYRSVDDESVHSHDHGYYLKCGNPNWSEDVLLSTLMTPHPPSYHAAGLDPDELERLSTALIEIERDELVKVLSQVPPTWPISTTDLEAIGFFLEVRAPAVANRLDALR